MRSRINRNKVTFAFLFLVIALALINISYAESKIQLLNTELDITNNIHNDFLKQGIQLLIPDSNIDININEVNAYNIENVNRLALKHNEKINRIKNKISDIEYIKNIRTVNKPDEVKNGIIKSYNVTSKNIKIKTDNSAFVENKDFEIGYCLSEVMRLINKGYTDNNIHDSNGNVTGHFKLTNR